MQSTSLHKIAIIGGGAAGFFAALSAAETAKEKNRHVEIKIFEASENFLKKVKISGGGRCNVTHNVFEVKSFCQNYPRGSKELISSMQQFQARSTVEWFAERGISLVAEEDGRMFPESNTSETIIKCFLDEARKYNIEILKSHGVQEIRKSEVGGFEIQIKDEVAYIANAVLIATGSSQLGYRLAQSLGHSLTELAPSLFSFKIEDPLIKELPGLSFSHVEVKLKMKDQPSFKEYGPILITHWGLSGPAILKLSAWAAREMMHVDYQAVLTVNWLAAKNLESVLFDLKKLKESNAKAQVGNIHLPNMASRFWLKILTKSQIDDRKKWADVTNKELTRLSKSLFASEFKVLGKNRFKDEFVECGGVNLKEVNFKTMESKIVPGLFFAGEILDIDGITGGFNFQNAWTGGWIVGRNI